MGSGASSACVAAAVDAATADELESTFRGMSPENKERLRRALTKTDAPAKTLAALCQIHGVPGSMNCMGPILLALTAGCGEMKQCMPFSDTTKPEFLAINPFHTVPALKDGEFCLGESSAILRYMARKYAPETYSTDPVTAGFIDWAMDRFTLSMYKDAAATIYPVLGYAAPPEDKAAAGKTCTENLESFAAHFLKAKFIGGEKLSIADYQVAPFFACYQHPALKEKGSVECPARIQQFNKDFKKACGASGMLLSAGGYALVEMLNKAGPEMDVAQFDATVPGDLGTGSNGTAKQPAGKVEIHGVPGSMNCMGPILLAHAAGCGEMKQCMPFSDTTKPEFLAINPFHAVPALKDGEFCLGESSATLRYMARKYAPDAYPADPAKAGFIDWAMDRFATSMYSDAAATIYPALGYAAPPEDKAAAGKKCTENLESFAAHFLKAKFIGGDKPSIADYKVAPFFVCYEHPLLKEKSLVECPARIKEFNKDFKEACGAAGMLEAAGGYALKEMLDEKAKA